MKVGVAASWALAGVTTAVLAALGASSARAQVVDDPLHMCYNSPGGCTSFNGVTISTTASTGLSGWGVSSAPASESGTLYISLLVPNNEAEVSLPTLAGTLNGSALTIGSWVNEGTFSSGDLTTLLGSPFAGNSPPNPFSAYSGATTALDSSFSDYTVYLAKVNGTFTTGSHSGQTNMLDNSFNLTGGDYDQGVNELTGVGPGSILTAFLEQMTTNKKGVTTTSVITTAQSSALVLDAPGVPVLLTSVPEPSTWAMMLIGFAGLGFAGYRKAHSARTALPAA
jgi:hypothetical protein